MACLFAARLVAAGATVTLLGGWTEGIRAIQAGGVWLQELDGSSQTYPVRAVLAAAGAATGVRGRDALVLVKAWQTAEAAARLGPCLELDGVCLTLQNGLGNREQLAAALGPDRVAAGTVSAGATLLGPGRVRAGGPGSITLGPHPRLGRLATALDNAGFAMERSPSVEGALWGKAVINAGINPLTALLDVRNGALLDSPPARALMMDVAREAAVVASAQGISLPYPDPAAAVVAVAARTAANISSMLQDLRRGAPTEIAAICGAIARAADESRVPAPLNQTLWRLVEARAQRPEVII